MQNKLKGFTLIELLVVIAIIGILSGLIIVSMSGATNGAKDARIKSEMDQLRSTAVMYYYNQSPNSYGESDTIVAGTCHTGSVVHFMSANDGLTLCTDINTQGGTGLTGSIVTGSSGSFCIIKPLVSSGATNWCIDSTGYEGAASACSTTCTLLN